MRVIIHFNKSSKIKEFNRNQIISFIFCITLFFMGLLGTLISFYINSSPNSLLAENRNLKATIRELTNKINSIQNSLSKIYETERLLRIAAGVDFENNYATGGEEDINIKKLLSSKSTEVQTITKLTDDLINKVKFEQEKFHLLVKKFEEKSELAKHIPAILPMDGYVTEHGFGMRLHPILKIWRMHEGVDIMNLPGTPVYAAGAGKIAFAGWNGSLGLCVIIDHGFGYETTYGHLSKINVREGQRVTRFQKIGECGSSGLSTGSHLHYEVSFNGQKQNPVYYFIK